MHAALQLRSPLACGSRAALWVCCFLHPAGLHQRPGSACLHCHQMGELAGTVEEWAKWLEACRTGLRRPLGLDMDRRRYWAFGGTAAAWRVWVEEEQGGAWGYYEGVVCFALLWPGSTRSS